MRTSLIQRTSKYVLPIGIVMGIAAGVSSIANSCDRMSAENSAEIAVRDSFQITTTQYNQIKNNVKNKQFSWQAAKNMLETLNIPRKIKK